MAGRRSGLAGERSGLWWEFHRILGALRPAWVVIENVPGLLSSNEGQDMGLLLGSLAELGYGWAYRILDSQFFGVAQRRRRVFIVGHLGSWRRAAEVLFDGASLQRHPPARGKTREGIAPCLESGANRTGGTRPPGTTVDTAESLQVAGTLEARARTGGHDPGAHGAASGHLVTHSLTHEGFDASEDGTGRGTPLVAAPLTCGVDSQGKGGYAGRRREDDYNLVSAPSAARSGKGGFTDPKNDGILAFDTTQVTSAANRSAPKPGDPSHPVAAGAHPPAIAFNCQQDPVSGEVARAAVGGPDQAVLEVRPRRLTPVECERLQGFPDNWTAVNGMKDGPRYRMLGNAVTVPVAEWIGRRLLAAISA